MVLRVVQLRWIANDIEDNVIVLPSGGYPVQNDVRDRHVCSGERRLGFGLAGFCGFNLLGEFLGPRQLRRAAFCSARSASAAEIADRRAASAVNKASTSAGSSPRLSCERRTASGSSRSSFRSITALRLLLSPRSDPGGTPPGPIP